MFYTIDIYEKINNRTEYRHCYFINKDRVTWQLVKKITMADGYIGKYYAIVTNKTTNCFKCYNINIVG